MHKVVQMIVGVKYQRVVIVGPQVHQNSFLEDVVQNRFVFLCVVSEIVLVDVRFAVGKSNCVGIDICKKMSVNN